MNTVCLCTAVPAESRPLIEHFKLSLHRIRGIRCYTGGSVCLVETGIGKLKAAATVAAMLHSNKHIDALINIGIAGGTSDVGTRYLANTVVDKATAKHWYPHLPATRILPDIETIAIQTLDTASRDYQPDAAFDMEASGVMAAASAYLDNTRIQCLKSISDNPTTDIANINKAFVTDLITQCVTPIANLVDHYHSNPNTDNLSNQEINQLVQELSTHTHISVSDTHSIKRLLQRYHSLSDKLPTLSDLAEQQISRNIKSDLERRITHIGTRY